jgi:predicted DNA-binding transcriptional regulator AlpA
MRVILLSEEDLRDLIEESADRILRLNQAGRAASLDNPQMPGAENGSRRWLSVKQACAYSGLSRSSLYRHEKARKLVPRKVNGRVVYDRHEIDLFLENPNGSERGAS